MTNAPALFAVSPAISSDGTLSYTPALNGSGIATVTVSLRDSGGTANDGDDTSDPITFQIAITSIAEEVGAYTGLIQPDPSGPREKCKNRLS
jgi:hypothetical protein